MKTKIISILIGIMVFILVVLVLLTMENAMQDQVLWECYKANFENITLQGDFSGDLDCNQYYLNYYSGEKWTHQCSSWFFSDRMTCHDLCNIDCAYKNKQAGKPICVC
jgi:hypothetical protein